MKEESTPITSTVALSNSTLGFEAFYDEQFHALFILLIKENIDARCGRQTSAPKWTLPHFRIHTFFL